MLKTVNEHLDTVTINDIENHKIISDKDITKDLQKLLSFPADTNSNTFYGNPFLYHFQLKNLLKCKRENKDTIYDVYNSKDEWLKLVDSTRKRNRGGRTGAGNIWECFRINLGSIVMFKATTAKYLYKKYNATKVLDPTAGWGGRMLGAWALAIDYTGIDTNIEMKDAYNLMMDELNKHKNPLFDSGQQQMIWKSALDVDFSNIDYDFVLTSPPYSILEVYQHMTPWKTDNDFYVNFLIPLINKCIDNIQPGGKVCFNISPKMYNDIMELDFQPCDIEENLKQQMGKNKSKKQDKIYIWNC